MTVFDRNTSFNDIIARTLATIVPPTGVDRDPEWPYTLFASELAQIGVRVVDYRDTDRWPRERGPGWVEPGGKLDGRTLPYGRMVYGPRNMRYPATYGGTDKSRGAPEKIRRTWSQITTLMVHTAAVELEHKRWLGVPAHWGVSSEPNGGMPCAVLMHPAVAYMSHGNAANKFTVGLEISGDRDWTHPAQRAIVFAFMRLFLRLRTAACGFDVSAYVMPHRFASKGKADDPGGALWPQCWRYAEAHGYQLGPVLSRGLPLPFPSRSSRFTEADHAPYESAGHE